MNHLVVQLDQEPEESQTNKATNSTPRADMLAKGIITGVAVSVIIHAGRGIIGAMAKNPAVMFGAGLAAGMLLNKYRKEIATVSQHTAEETKDFVLRRKESLQGLLEQDNAAANLPKHLH